MSNFELYNQIKELPDSGMSLMDVNTTLLHKRDERVEEVLYALIYYHYNKKPPRPSSSSKNSVLYQETKLDKEIVTMICNFVGYLSNP